MEILSSRSQASEGIPFRLQLLNSRSPKEVGCSNAKGSARSQCSGVEVAQAVLKLIVGQYDCEFAVLTCLDVQCGQGERKGPDGHGSELGNRNRGLLHPALGQVRFQAKHMPECRPVGRNSAIGFSAVALLFLES